MIPGNWLIKKSPFSIIVMYNRIIHIFYYIKTNEKKSTFASSK